MRTHMNNAFKWAIVALLVVAGLAPVAQAANLANLTNTTLAASLTAAATQMTLTSGTGVTAASGSIINSYAIVDDELIGIQQPNPSTSTTIWRITRGLKGTLATSHANAAIVMIASQGQVFDNFLRGSCTASQVPYWPRITVSSGIRGTKSIYYEHCSGGVWREAVPLGDSAPVATIGALTTCNVNVGDTAYGSLGTSTAMVSGTEYLTSIYVPFTQKWTGIQVMQNATVGTDKAIGILRDADGNALANSATAGVTTSGANTFLSLPFTSALIVPGPAWYNIGIQGGTTATDGLRLIAASTYNGVRATSATGTFGTITATFTVPTTFTATKAPVVCLY